jgi:endonuclease/exonuclease/phosphatase family metal-dependent hydrolase
VRLVIRSWNVFHGNADPPRRKGFLRRMVELASADRPDVLCLQEIPVWALPRIDHWSGMRSFGAVTRAPLWLGPISTWVTRAHQGLFRSGLAGQANAILVASQHEASDLGHEKINVDGRERRLVQAVRLDRAGVVVGNLHASNEFRDPSVPRAEVDRARAFVESSAQPGDAIVLAGDFNLRAPVLDGYSRAGEGIDHVLVRGASAEVAVPWVRARRTTDGIVLSDHPPVDCVVEVDAR